jgi:hypothetical protein
MVASPRKLAILSACAPQRLPGCYSGSNQNLGSAATSAWRFGLELLQPLFKVDQALFGFVRTNLVDQCRQLTLLMFDALEVDVQRGKQLLLAAQHRLEQPGQNVAKWSQEPIRQTSIRLGKTLSEGLAAHPQILEFW